MTAIAPKNNISPAGQHKVQFQAFIKNEAVLKNISETLGSETKTKRFVASVISAVSLNPALQECQAPTIVSAALLGESLDLSPSPQLGHYYLVPFNDTYEGTTKAVFQLGYKGYIQLAIRSGQYKKMNVIAIKEGELIGYNPLDEELQVELIEDEYEREQRPTIGYYAMFELINGFRKTMYWSKRKMIAHADKYSQAFSKESKMVRTKRGEKQKVSFEDYVKGNYDPKDNWMYSSFWYKDFDGMAFKTMLRQLISKWGIMSIEMQSAYVNDMAFKDETGHVNYIENEADTEPVTPVVVENEAEPEATPEPEPMTSDQPATINQPSLL